MSESKDQGKAHVTLEKLVSLSRRRGFVFQSSEIYGGQSGAWDYGPLGVELKKNIQQVWWKEMTQMHDNIVGLDAAILMHPRVWEASGHVENFTDPLVECKKCKGRFRADHIDLNGPCPTCGNRGTLGEPRKFNLMFTTHIGPVEETASLIYLRPETAQGIFVNFKNVVASSRVKVPFGIAQVGKAFRNEIVTKAFIFRTAEFEQMEMQFFINPKEEPQWFEYWKKSRIDYYSNKLGIAPEHLRFHQHGKDELAHYAINAFDIEFLFPMGWQELEGIHSRSDYDLRRHQEFSGDKQEYLDQESGERFLPFVIETSAGLTRSVLMVLTDAYEEEVLGEGDVRTVLHFHPNLAPVKVAVMPVVKKDGLLELAQDLEKSLREDFATMLEPTGNIGKNYRRQDEIGTPYCLTVDYQTKEDQTVTIRYRDSMKQERVKIAELSGFIRNNMKNYRRGQ
ncbi:MAG: glycine--tRNA ligase [Spirochaetales bacterium]|nr:glycine--tRNA ligase [Spirochaetales bacterium]